MRLEDLGELTLRYVTDAHYDGKLVLVRPYGGEEGTGYGRGDGEIRGPRLSGSLSWSNVPHRRSDGAMLPNAAGVIVTDDGAAVIFTLAGRTTFDAGRGIQLLFTAFEAEDARYAWLNDAVCVAEGVIDAEALTMRARVFRCLHDLR